MSDILNAVVVGYGGMGSRHAQLLRTIDGIRITGAYDIDPAKQQRIRDDGLFSYDSFESVCADSNISLAVIATPNQLHKPMAIALMRAGKHVVCEKPVTLEPSGLAEIMQVQKETGMLFSVHQNRRWDEDYLSVCQLYKDGRIGSVYNVESRVTGSRGVPRDWRRDPACGGGMLMDWGVHLIDQILCLVPSKVKNVFCRLSYVTGAPVDDGFLILLTFENGLTATLEASTWKFLNLPRWYVNGSKGTAAMERWHHDGTLAVLRDDASTQDAKPVVTAAGITKTMAPREDDSVIMDEFSLAPSQPRAFYENIVRAIRGEEPQQVQTHQVMRTMKLIETARQSNACGKALDFE